MATKLDFFDEETGVTLKPNHIDLWIYPPGMIKSLKILTDPSRCDLDKDEPADESFLRSLVATGGNIEPILARRDSSGQVWVFEGRRRKGGTDIVNADPEYWSQFTPAGIAPPPLPLQVRIMRVTEEEALRLSLHGNNSKKLSAIDLAFAARNFTERCGWDQEKVAAEMGVSGSQVSYLLRLLELPLRVQKQLHKGKLKVATAQALYGHPIDVVEAAMDRFDRGEEPREILMDLKEAKRAKVAKAGKKLSRSLPELKKDLERIAAGKNIAAANRAGQLLDYLAGNESQSLAVTLAKDDDTPRALPVPAPVASRGTDVAPGAFLEGEARP